MVRNDPFVRIRLEFTGKVLRWMNQVLYWNPSRCHTAEWCHFRRPSPPRRYSGRCVQHWGCGPFSPKWQKGDAAIHSCSKVNGGTRDLFHFWGFQCTLGQYPIHSRFIQSSAFQAPDLIFNRLDMTIFLIMIFPMDIPNGCSHMISKGSPRTRRCVNRIWCGGGWPSQHPANTQGLRWWTLPFWRYRFQWDFWMMNKHSVWRCQYYQLSSHGNPVL